MDFQITALSNLYQVRKLSQQDIPIISNLLSGNPKFHPHLKTVPTAESVAEDLQALPFNKE